MSVKICTQEPFRKLLDNESVVEVSGGTVREALISLHQRYPTFVERMLTQDGLVHRFVNIYVNEEDIRFLEQQHTRLRDGDEIRIIPSIAGG